MENSRWHVEVKHRGRFLANLYGLIDRKRIALPNTLELNQKVKVTELLDHVFKNKPIKTALENTVEINNKIVSCVRLIPSRSGNKKDWLSFLQFLAQSNAAGIGSLGIEGSVAFLLPKACTELGELFAACLHIEDSEAVCLLFLDKEQLTLSNKNDDSVTQDINPDRLDANDTSTSPSIANESTTTALNPIINIKQETPTDIETNTTGTLVNAGITGTNILATPARSDANNPARNINTAITISTTLSTTSLNPVINIKQEQRSPSKGSIDRSIKAEKNNDLQGNVSVTVETESATVNKQNQILAPKSISKAFLPSNPHSLVDNIKNELDIDDYSCKEMVCHQRDFVAKKEDGKSGIDIIKDHYGSFSSKSESENEKSLSEVLVERVIDDFSGDCRESMDSPSIDVKKNQATGNSSLVFVNKDKETGHSSSVYVSKDKATGNSSSVYVNEDKATTHSSLVNVNEDKAIGHSSSAYANDVKTFGHASSVYANEDKATGHSSSVYANEDKSIGLSSSVYVKEDKDTIHSSSVDINNDQAKSSVDAHILEISPQSVATHNILHEEKRNNQLEAACSVDHEIDNNENQVVDKMPCERAIDQLEQLKMMLLYDSKFNFDKDSGLDIVNNVLNWAYSLKKVDKSDNARSDKEKSTNHRRYTEHRTESQKKDSHRFKNSSWNRSSQKQGPDDSRNRHYYSGEDENSYYHSTKTKKRGLPQSGTDEDLDFSDKMALHRYGKKRKIGLSCTESFESWPKGNQRFGHDDRYHTNRYFHEDEDYFGEVATVGTESVCTVGQKGQNREVLKNYLFGTSIPEDRINKQVNNTSYTGIVEDSKKIKRKKNKKKKKKKKKKGNFKPPPVSDEFSNVSSSNSSDCVFGRFGNANKGSGFGINVGRSNSECDESKNHNVGKRISISSSSSEQQNNVKGKSYAENVSRFALKSNTVWNRGLNKDTVGVATEGKIGSILHHLTDQFYIMHLEEYAQVIMRNDKSYSCRRVILQHQHAIDVRISSLDKRRRELGVRIYKELDRSQFTVHKSLYQYLITRMDVQEFIDDKLPLKHNISTMLKSDKSKLLNLEYDLLHMEKSLVLILRQAEYPQYMQLFFNKVIKECREFLSILSK